MLQLKKLDYWIISLMFFLLPIDMINGILLHNNINLPLSISQLFKFSILLLLVLRLTQNNNKLLLLLISFLSLLIPTLYQVFKQIDLSFLFSDFIKITRYLLPLLSFLFFAEVFKRNNILNHKRAYGLIKFSYKVLIINIFIKYLGLGYPMYSFGNIGSRGFFHAGNELSVLLIILCSIIAFNLWKNGKTRQYYLFLILNVLASITLSSKTGILGILIVFLFIPINPTNLKTNLKRFKKLILLLFIGLPIVISLAWEIIKNSTIFVRFVFFWEKLDLLTFILSNRNNFAERAKNNYTEKYDFIEKLIGVGQTKYELLNYNKIVEIDFLDIFFAYGYIGLLLFTLLMVFMMFQTFKLKRNTFKYEHASFVFMMLFVILSISSIAGHVFNSGMAAIFLGLLFALSYLKTNEQEENNIRL
jgi:hypothetical protein